MGTLLTIKVADFATNAVKRIDPDEPTITWSSLPLGTAYRNSGFIGISSGQPVVNTDAYWGKIFTYTELADIPAGALQVRGEINNLILGTNQNSAGLPIIVFYDSSENYISMVRSLTTVEATVANQSAITKNYGKKGQVRVDIPTNASKFRLQWISGTDSGVGDLSQILINTPTIEYSIET